MTIETGHYNASGKFVRKFEIPSDTTAYLIYKYGEGKSCRLPIRSHGDRFVIQLDMFERKELGISEWTFPAGSILELDDNYFIRAV